MENLNLNKIFKISVVFGIFIASGAVFYYFVIFLPQVNTSNLAINWAAYCGSREIGIVKASGEICRQEMNDYVFELVQKNRLK